MSRKPSGRSSTVTRISSTRAGSRATSHDNGNCITCVVSFATSQGCCRKRSVKAARRRPSPLTVVTRPCTSCACWRRNLRTKTTPRTSILVPPASVCVGRPATQRPCVRSISHPGKKSSIRSKAWFFTNLDQSSWRRRNRKDLSREMTRKPMQSYDAIIIGTGQAGPALAQRLVDAGRSVAVIERKFFGGTCVNTGCTPTKTLVASAYAAHMARRAADFGVKIPCDITVDMKAVKARKDHVSGNSRQGVVRWLKNLKGCTVYEGHARFAGPHSVKVADEILQANWIFIN